MNLQIVNSNTVLSFSDSGILYLYNPSKMSSDGICVIAYLNEATICSKSGESILLRSNGGYDLHQQEHPIVDKDLRLDDFHSFDYGIHHLV